MPASTEGEAGTPPPILEPAAIESPYLPPRTATAPAPATELDTDRVSGHPGSGIASLIIGSICTLCFVAILLYFTMVQRGIVHDYKTPEEAAMLKSLVALSIAFLCNVVLGLVGLGLGITGLIRSRRNHQHRLLPVLGISLNVLVLLAFGAMTALALVRSP